MKRNSRNGVSLRVALVALASVLVPLANVQFAHALCSSPADCSEAVRCTAGETLSREIFTNFGPGGCQCTWQTYTPCLSTTACSGGVCRAIFPPTGKIDDVLPIAKGGARILVQGPLECPEGQRVRGLWVTATQETTGAFAQKRWRGKCTGTTQTWSLVLKASERPFVPGPAQVCAAAVFERKGRAQFSKQWCVDATLVED